MQVNLIDQELLRLVNQVRRHKHSPEISVLADDLRLRDGLGFESLDLAELTVRIEERFGIDVFEEGVVDQWGVIRERIFRHVRHAKQLE